MNATDTGSGQTDTTEGTMRTDARMTYTAHGKILTWRGLIVEDPHGIVSEEQMRAELERMICDTCSPDADEEE